MMFARVEIVPVVAAAVMAFGLGAVWFSPLLFASAWQKLSGVVCTEEDKKKAGPAFAAQFVLTLAMAFILHYVLGRTNSASYLDAAKKSLALWGGFVAPAMSGMVLWEKKPFALFLINAGFYLASLILMGAVFIAFR